MVSESFLFLEATTQTLKIILYSLLQCVCFVVLHNITFKPQRNTVYKMCISGVSGWMYRERPHLTPTRKWN